LILFPLQVNQTDLEKLFPERAQTATSSNSAESAERSIEDDNQNNSRVQCQQKMAEQLRNKSCDLDEPKANEKFSFFDFVTKLISEPHFMLLSAIGKLILMFCVNWKCSVVVLTTALVSWFYLGRTCAVANRGCSEFNLFSYVRNLFEFAQKKTRGVYDEIVVHADTKPCMQVKSTVITEEGSDFADREKYHQASSSSQIQH
jgi:hypothetical protein